MTDNLDRFFVVRISKLATGTFILNLPELDLVDDHNLDFDSFYGYLRLDLTNQIFSVHSSLTPLLHNGESAVARQDSFKDEDVFVFGHLALIIHYIPHTEMKGAIETHEFAGKVAIMVRRIAQVNNLKEALWVASAVYRGIKDPNPIDPDAPGIIFMR